MASSVSAKEISDEMWFCLCRFTDAHKDSDTGVWTGKLGFDEDMITCWKSMELWQKEMDKQLGFEV
jgi:hypothetical protein